MANNKNGAGNVTNGITYIRDILKEVADIFSDQQKKQEAYYGMPRFIYRGITKFYPYWDIESKGISKPSMKAVEDDYIRSGLSLKLYKSSKSEKNPVNALAESGYIRINYINALENLLRNARKHYPEQYDVRWPDLNILADIQHNGGATCLVDFSKNILTALWFACNNDIEDDGFIYCYDIMEDMIVRDTLTMIKPKDENKSIRELLLQTYKETNISSDTTARFCLWEPSPRSTRILRQDSVFMFGIERFKVNNHGIKIIRIPAERKICILQAMKGLFNVTGTAIYNDNVGFASMNSKLSHDYKLTADPYCKGYVNMIYGHYSSALDYLKLWEGNNSEQLSDRRNLELCFSLAVCYKNLDEDSTSDNTPKSCHGIVSKLYYDNAILEYNKVVNFARNILRSQDLSMDERRYYQTKCTRAMNGIMDLLFELKRYSHAIDYCDTIIREITHGCLRNCETAQDSNEMSKNLNPRYCEIEKMELLDLDILTRKLANDERNNYIMRMENYYQEAMSHPENSFFDKLLIEYYKFVFDLAVWKGQKIPNSLKVEVVRWRELLRNNSTPDKYDNYVSWNFIDIKKVIDELDERKYGEKKEYLLYATAYMISFRDEFEMQNWGRSSEM